MTQDKMWSELQVRSSQKRRREEGDYRVPIGLRNCQIGDNHFTTEDGSITSENEDSDSAYEDDGEEETEDGSEEEEDEEDEEEEEEDVNELVAEAEVIKSRVDRETQVKKERVRRDVWFRKVVRVWEEWEAMKTEYKIVNSKPRGTFWGRHEPDYAMCVRHGGHEYYISVLESGALSCECEEFQTMEIMDMIDHLRKKENGLSASSETVCAGDQPTATTPHCPGQ
jgi:hypothetical protein